MSFGKEGHDQLVVISTEVNNTWNKDKLDIKTVLHLVMSYHGLSLRFFPASNFT